MSRKQSDRLHRQQAAIFVDYDNLLDVIRAESSGDKYPDEYAAEILGEIQRYLKNSNNLPTSITRAYADFGALDDEAPYIQRALQRDGFEPRYVPTELQRNAVELQLGLDVVDAVGAHASLDTVVIVTGDRLYLPLIRRVVEQGRHVVVALLFPPAPEDTPFFVKDDVFLDARNLLSEDSRRAFPDGSAGSGHESTPTRLEPHEYQPLTDPVVRRTVAITDEFFGQYDEVYLTPLLRKLSDILGPEHDPKSLISRLEEAGAVRLEKRNGYPYDYTVLIVHEDHPDVQDIKAANASQHGYGDGYYDEDDTADERTPPYDEPSDADRYEAEDNGYDDTASYDDAYDDEYNDEAWEESEETP